MVCGLARPRVLRLVAGTKSPRARERPATGVARRIVAPCDHGQPLLGAEQARSVVPLRRLRLPRRSWINDVSISDAPHDAAIHIARLVRAHGGRALIVGGWVRDRLMSPSIVLGAGRPSKDVDIEV